LRELWVEIEDALPLERKRAILEASSKHNGTVILKGDGVRLAKSYGVRTASFDDGDIKLVDEAELARRMKQRKTKPLGVKISIKDARDEDKVANAIEKSIDYVILRFTDWKIIPTENIIAKAHGKTKLLAEVAGSQEAKLAFETLELGVDGVVLKTSDLDEIESVAAVTATARTRLDEKEKASKITLTVAKITSCKQLGIGSRVCVDTCDMLIEGEGILVGSQSSGLFLIQAEVGEDLKSEPRPFRVNAGAVFLYVLTPCDKTRYLSELQAGDEVLIVDRQGNSRSVNIGRVKIEKRPMVLIEAEVDGRKIRTIAQNAETIRLVSSDGVMPVTELKQNDQVLVRVQEGGRHFGVKVEKESVIER